MTAALCPNSANHVLGPATYVHWHDWAQRKSRTHTQSQCLSCGLWLIWTRKRSN